MKTASVLITCEHGGNRIPPAYRSHFAGREALLASHRGHDPGALALARDLAHRCHARLVYSTTSRLLVELNRSPGHPRLYSEVTRRLPEALRHELYVRHYLPYRHEVEAFVVAALRARRCVIHVSAHSFTPVLRGERRRADIGLLYDPARSREAALCRAWQAELRSALPGLVVRRNYPYRGAADGLTTHLRRRFPAAAYLGIEIEVNQRHTLPGGRSWHRLRAAITAAFSGAVAKEDVLREKGKER